MNYLSQNFKYLRKLKGYTQEQMAEMLGIKRPSIGAYEEGRADPPLALLSKLAGIFRITVDQLLHKNLERTGLKSGTDTKVLAITVDKEERENIELIPQKASAGYLNGYADPEYIQEMPKFNLPHLPTGTYRAFEIKGDSMLPLVSGTIIVGQYVEQLRDIKNGRTYVLVTSDEGVVYKRVFNYLDEKGKLFLVSDNSLFSPYEIEPHQILEIWEAKAFISMEFPNPTESNITLESLSEMLKSIHKYVIRIAER
ncbi:helix-turn-helix domain-containing protein [Cytophagales bacterium LB-30]|uniref:Helix-turn-helix domain-containing protein n=1 Tax=Shiella aurantiaca TaxID=3058365 RepID=A0ABT8F521_9BACT|nr:helix-turn-helix domain-containing protein [Shiella aurantiaca]MDN4165354.1 helix-turn-helix domain-containing protein [Shiella aurantiaca]